MKKTSRFFNYQYIDSDGNTSYTDYIYTTPSAAYNACVAAGDDSCKSYCDSDYWTYKDA